MCFKVVPSPPRFVFSSCSDFQVRFILVRRKMSRTYKWHKEKTHCRERGGSSRLFEGLEELGSGTLGNTVGEVEDCTGGKTPIVSRYNMGFSETRPLTLLNTVLLGTVVVLVLLHLGHTLDTLVVVVLSRGTCGSFGALYSKIDISLCPLITFL